MNKQLSRSLISFSIIFMLSACGGDNPTGPGRGPHALVLNSVGNSISIIELADKKVWNDYIELGANSTAVGFSVRGNRAIVPNGAANNVTVIDTDKLTEIGTIDLPAGSGATGSAFLDDNIAFVGNFNLASVAKIDLRTLQVTDTIGVGLAPSAIAVANGKVFVVNANLDLTTFQSVGNGTISVIDPATSQVTNTIDAGATNSQFLHIDSDGELIVVNSGEWGAGNGSISVIDPVNETLTAGPFLIGDFPGEININNDGMAYIASFSAGLYAFDTRSNTVVRDGSNALAALSSSGIAIGAAGVDFDDDGNIYSVNSGNAPSPGTVFIFDSNETLIDSVKVGIGAFAISIQ